VVIKLHQNTTARVLQRTGKGNSVGFSNDNKYIVSGSIDQSVRMWSVENGEEMMKLEGHTSEVYSVGFPISNSS